MKELTMREKIEFDFDEILKEYRNGKKLNLQRVAQSNLNYQIKAIKSILN